MQSKAIKKAKELLENEELVAIPTETVYGLAGNAYSTIAVKKIYELKGRPSNNPLIVHIKSRAYLDQVAQNIPEQAYKLAETFWPGPLTLVLEKQDRVPALVSAHKNTVGVRVPNHPLTLNLLEALDFPLVAPSANTSNHISPTCKAHVQASFGEKSPYVLDGGPCEAGLESTILGFKGSEILLYRHGVLSKELLSAFLGQEIVEHTHAPVPESPGMFLKHYAPHTPLYFYDDNAFKAAQEKNLRIGFLNFRAINPYINPENQRILSPLGSLEEAAKNLYRFLYELDALGLDLIFAEQLPPHGIGKAIHDKLYRASQK